MSILSVESFDEKTGFQLMRKTELEKYAKSHGVKTSPDWTKADYLKIFAGLGVNKPGEFTVRQETPEAVTDERLGRAQREKELWSIKHFALMSIAKRLGVECTKGRARSAIVDDVIAREYGQDSAYRG